VGGGGGGMKLPEDSGDEMGRRGGRGVGGGSATEARDRGHGRRQWGEGVSSGENDAGRGRNKKIRTGYWRIGCTCEGHGLAQVWNSYSIPRV
jgi:hypothetical protein